jgi:hypothetical protein
MASQYINSVIERELEEIEEEVKKRKEEKRRGLRQTSLIHFVYCAYFSLKCAVSVVPSSEVKITS